MQLVSGIGGLFLLLVLVSMVAFVGEKLRDDRVARAELSGLPAAEALLALSKRTAEHRGAAAGVLAGEAAFTSMRAAKQIEVDAALAAALATTRHWPTSRIARLRDDISAEWQRLRQAIDQTALPSGSAAGRGQAPAGDGGAISGAESFRQHSSLVQHQLELLDEIVSASTLALDSEPVAHHLTVAALQQQPQLGEMLGQLRGLGTGMLARPTFAAGDASLIVTMLTNRRRMFDAGFAQLRRAGAIEPTVLVALAPHMEHARTTFEQAAAMIENELLQTVRPHMAATTYFATVSRAIDALAAMGNATFAILSANLATRADAAGRAVIIALAVGAGLVVLSSCMIVAIIRAVRRDIARRERALRDAAHSSAFLSAVLDAAPDAIAILDARGAIALVNTRVEQALGYPRDELLGKPAHLVFPRAALAVDRKGEDPLPTGRAGRAPPPRLASLVDQKGEDPLPTGGAGRAPLPRLASLVDQKGEDAAFRVVTVDCARKDGTQIPIELSMSPVEIGDARHTIIIGRDLSERRAMERQLHQSQKMESIGQLTGGLAHDFNNLLGVIVGNLDLLERHIGGNAKALARVQTAQRAAMRGADLTRRLLAFARRQELNPQPTSVNQLIDELLEMLPRTLGAEVRIATKLTRGLPSATVDPSGLESALLNLALNARDAMNGGGRLSVATSLISLDAEYAPVRTGEIAAGSYVQITVSDTGHGMSQETVGKVFEPFFTTKPRGKGTGLGLAMVYGFVKQSRGNIRIYSEVGVGTTFTIYLPVADISAVSQPIPASARALPGGGLTGTVLIVDDEVDLLEIAVSYCEELGLSVLHATDGISALEVATGEPHVDLLLTDVVMPGSLNGVALAARLRDRYPALKVAYCSGFPSSALAERNQLRVDGPLINKPYRKTTFMSTVTELLTPPPTTTKEHAA